MLDLKYFKTDFKMQVEGLGPGPVAAFLVLRDGREFAIQRIRAVAEQYLLLSVFPSEVEPRNEASVRATFEVRKRKGADDVVHDELAIGYEEISHVRLTIACANSKMHLG